MNNFQDKANFIWQVADDILRGTFKQHEYGDVILPFVVLRRLDCVLGDRKDDVIKTYNNFKDKLPDPTQVLLKATKGVNFYNTSFYDLRRLSQDPANIELNFNNYINGYSKNVREIIENFQIDKIVTKLVKNDLLFMLVDKFTEIDLNPRLVKNHEMGYIFEELLRRFSEISNETAGEHYTPREVIRLMVNLLFAEHQKELKGKGIIRTVYDPACGTGGMLTIAKDHIQKEINPDVEIIMYGQELNEQTYAIAKSAALIMGEDADNIHLGTSFSDDKLKGNKFNFMLSNPPFGVSWKKEQEFIKNESNDPHGRFHAGLPRISDGALLFLQHMISKMEPKGGRIAIIHSGSPLFTGDAGSGESNIRKWIIENDWLETIVALPTEFFYNTCIATYIWIVTNRKPKQRKGKVQLIDAVDMCQKTRRGVGHKRNFMTNEQLKGITRIYTDFEEGKNCMICDNESFGHTKITIERPLTESSKIVRDKNGHPKPDVALRYHKKIPLTDDIDEYFKREVKQHISDAWMDRSMDKIGYEIKFDKYRIKSQIDTLETQYKSYRGYRLADIVTEVSFGETNTILEEKENAIYIPRLGTSPVISDLKNATLKHQNYIQVVLKDTIVKHKYAELFFSSELGTMVLKSLYSGDIIPKINKRDLDDALDDVIMPIPGPEEQDTIINTNKELTNLEQTIAIFKSELSLNPKSAMEIQDNIDNMRNHLNLLSDADRIRSIVRKGESKTIEFKETFSLDVNKGTKEKYIETSALKTIVAFLNTDGGDFLVGIADSGDVKGIDAEVKKFYKGSIDNFKNHIKNCFRVRIGEAFYPLYDPIIVRIDGLKVFHVKCRPSDSPCFLDSKEFYVRTNPATDKLEGPQLVYYINRHFTPDAK